MLELYSGSCLVLVASRTDTEETIRLRKLLKFSLWRVTNERAEKKQFSFLTDKESYTYEGKKTHSSKKDHVIKKKGASKKRTN